jgi:hypothetical protein
MHILKWAHFMGRRGGEWLWVYMTDICLLTLELRSGRFGASPILCKSELNAYSQLCNDVKGIAGKIETPTQWNPISSRMTALSPVLSPSSILRHLHFIVLSFSRQEFRRGVKKILFEFSIYFLNFVSWNWVRRACILCSSQPTCSLPDLTKFGTEFV